MTDGDDLDVGVRVVGAEDLDVDLVVLAEPAGLGRLVPEARGRRPDLPRSRRAVLDEGPGHRRGDLGPQGQPPAAAVLELVHLLADDVGALPQPVEDRRVLEHRRVHQPVARGLGLLGERGQQGDPARRLRGQDVAGPDGRLEGRRFGLGHGR